MHDTANQIKFWRELTQLKEQTIYFHLYQNTDNQIEYWKNIILAVTASSAIGAWAVWQAYPMVWGAIIALSQIIQAISPLLPYKKRMAYLNTLSNEYDILCIKMEDDWYEIAKGIKSDDEIHDRLIKVKKKILNIEEKTLKGYIIPIKKHLSKKSVTLRETYFKNQTP